VPTSLPRFQVTETAEIAHALEVAEHAWPDLPRAERVKRLLEQGAEAIERRDEDRLARRRAAVRDSSGIFTGHYEPGHLQSLRDEWPA